MTKSVDSVVNEAVLPTREPRPFLFLEPARVPTRSVTLDAIGLDWLDAEIADAVPSIARSLVNYSIALQNRSSLERGNRQPIQLSVINRRRRAARAWVNAVVAGKIDAATQHAVSTQWVPVLCGTGPDPRSSRAGGRKFVEFLRGSITAYLFSDPAENLLPHARALHVLEEVLRTHLSAVVQQTRTAAK